ncbi:imidazolonepropionase [Cardiobacteriaceae bacterium TAE3-ERU3]|nr:imidazolonepropionase [Cardiobacteriaceae bacterium TAE3-ERU3]
MSIIIDSGMAQWDALWVHANIATMYGEEYGIIEDGAVAVRDGKIAWVGRSADLGDYYQAQMVHDCSGKWLTPGLIDCHTHIVYGGNRSNEFEARLNGVDYAEIAANGGGILATVNATRNASEDELFAQALPRVQSLLAEGVTTLEIKSGYGLDLESEHKMLRVARRIEQELPVNVRTTYLAAHALPTEYKDRADDYVDAVCEWMQPLAAEGLIDAVDGFCEHLAFSAAQMQRVFDAAKALGLPVKLHAEQLSDQGGAELVATYHGLSADHLEYLSDDGIAAMAKHDTVAVLSPGAFYTLRETQYPPLDAMRAAGLRIALATDCNPGTSPLTSLLLTMNMGCTLFRMTPLEALQGTTVHAAHALGLGEHKGIIAPGYDADFAIWQIDRPADLSYMIGFNPLVQRVCNGEISD